MGDPIKRGIANDGKPNGWVLIWHAPLVLLLSNSAHTFTAWRAGRKHRFRPVTRAGPARDSPQPAILPP